MSGNLKFEKNLNISEDIKNFCIMLFEDKLQDDSYIPLIEYFKGWEMPIDEPISLKIKTDHLKYNSKYDFQVQLLLTSFQFDLFCSYFNNSEQTGHSFYYHHYHNITPDTMEGDFNAVENWVKRNYVNSINPLILEIEFVIDSFED